VLVLVWRLNNRRSKKHLYNIMKKIIITALLVFGMNALWAQVNTGTTTTGTSQHPNVPASVNARFGTDYPNTSATWRMDGSNYAASWTDKTTNMGRTVIYDKNGNLISNDNEMSNGTYPSGISDYYSQNYPGEDYKVWSSMDSKGNTSYYTMRNGQRVHFDKDGKYTTGIGMNNGTGKKKTGTKKTGTGTKTGTDNGTGTNSGTGNK
jgi:hypothetical protein